MQLICNTNINGDISFNKKHKLKTIILATLTWGLIAHAYILFNEIAYHDAAINISSVGASIISGRWMLKVMYFISESLFLEGIFATPVINGLFTLAVLGVIIYIISEMFDIKQTKSLVLLSGCLVVFPQVTCMMFYMYTAPYYALGCLMGVCGVSMLKKKINIKRIICAVVLMTCSVGTYQASIPVILSLMVLSLIHEEMLLCDSENKAPGKKWLNNWAIYVGCFVICMVLYFVVTKITLKITHNVLTDYQNINSFGMCSFSEYIDRILFAYKEFMIPAKGTQREMFPFLANALHTIVIILIFGIQLLDISRKWKNEKLGCIRTLVLMLLFPLAANFIFVMCEVKWIHGIMMYSQAMIFVYLIMLLDHTRIEINSKWITQKNIRRFICILLLFLNFLYCRFSNMCYIKAEITQTRYLDYMETLSNTIVSLEDYDKDVPVAYIGDLKKTNLFDYMNDQLAAIRLHPYDVISSLDGRTWINDYAWKETMALWCGFSPVLVDNTYEWEQLEEVKNMPVYPKTGSVRMVNGAVVVKFSEN